MADAASIGPAPLAAYLDADLSPDWLRAGGMRLATRVYGSPPPTRAIVIHRADVRVIGDVRFEPYSDRVPTRRTPAWREGVVEIGYAIVPDYRRQGYASEAMGRVIDWLIEDPSVQNIIAGCDTRNRASVRTLRKLGFVLDGTGMGRSFWWYLNRAVRDGLRPEWPGPNN